MIVLSWIYSYICNWFLSPLTLWVQIPLGQCVLDTTLFDKVCHWLATDRWFSSDTPVSSSSANETDHHDITGILLKVALTLNIITCVPWFFFNKQYIYCCLLSILQTCLQKFSAIAWRKQVTFWWDDNSIFLMSINRIDGVMVSVLASRAVYGGFNFRSGPIKDYEIGICCFSAYY